MKNTTPATIQDVLDSQTTLRGEMAAMKAELKQDIRESTEVMSNNLRDFMQMVADEFTRVHKQLAQSDKQFAHINEQLTYMNHRFTTLDSTNDTILGAIDSLYKRHETDEQERLVMGYQLTRHERWANELANKVGHTLTA